MINKETAKHIAMRALNRVRDIRAAPSDSPGNALTRPWANAKVRAVVWGEK